MESEQSTDPTDVTKRIKKTSPSNRAVQTATLPTVLQVTNDGHIMEE